MIKLAERILFYGSLALSILMIFLSSYNPSLDGPSHLYNARLLNSLLSGNDFVQSFYSINKVPIPNLTDHFLLALFNIVFPPALSLKLLLTLCVCLLALSFRRLIGLVRPENIGLSAFSIPLAHSFLFYIGFYNFCLSQGLMVWAIFYYLKHLHSLGTYINAKKYLAMLSLLTLVYFTNGLSFLLAGLVLLLLETGPLFALIKSKQFGRIGRRVFWFASLWLPGVTCFIAFILLIPVPTVNPPVILSFHEHLQWIYHIRPLDVYSGIETKYTRGFFCLIALLTATGLYMGFKRGSFLRESNLLPLLIATIAVLVLYFTVPDSASVGMMSYRLCFYLFLFFILWLCVQQNIKVVKWAVIILVYCLNWMLFFTQHWPVIKQLDSTAQEIVDASKYIKPNSIVLPIECTGNWCMEHFIDYTGIDEPFINPTNYEANTGWFPITWKNGVVDTAFINKEYRIPHTLIWNEPSMGLNREIDYIFVLGDMNKVRTEYLPLSSNIKNKCSLTYFSNDSLIHIYKVNHKQI